MLFPEVSSAIKCNMQMRTTEPEFYFAQREIIKPQFPNAFADSLGP